MRIFVLYCLFLFPLSYVIAKNGYVEQNSVKLSFLTEQDTLYNRNRKNSNKGRKEKRDKRETGRKAQRKGSKKKPDSRQHSACTEK